MCPCTCNDSPYVAARFEDMSRGVVPWLPMAMPLEKMSCIDKKLTRAEVPSELARNRCVSLWSARHPAPSPHHAEPPLIVLTNVTGHWRCPGAKGCARCRLSKRIIGGGDATNSCGCLLSVPRRPRTPEGPTRRAMHCRWNPPSPLTGLCVYTFSAAHVCQFESA